MLNFLTRKTLPSQEKTSGGMNRQGSGTRYKKAFDVKEMYFFREGFGET